MRFLTLRLLVDECHGGAALPVVVDISTAGCVYLTAMDGFSYDLKVIILEDCCATHDPEIHEMFIKALKKMPSDPLVRVFKMDDFLNELERIRE